MKKETRGISRREILKREDHLTMSPRLPGKVKNAKMYSRKKKKQSARPA